MAIVSPEMLKTQRWRCTHGHKWESPADRSAISFSAINFGEDAAIGISRASFCSKCFYEFCRKHFGEVKKDSV